MVSDGKNSKDEGIIKLSMQVKGMRQLSFLPRCRFWQQQTTKRGFQIVYVATKIIMTPFLFPSIENLVKVSSFTFMMTHKFYKKFDKNMHKDF